MSDSVPAEDPLETSTTTRRLGHPELPQPVTKVESPTPSTSATLSAGTTGPVLTLGPPATTTVHEPKLHHVVSAPGDELSRQSLAISDSFSISHIPSAVGGQGAPQSSTQTYSQTTFATSSPDTSARGLSQKPTRRTKAHVASACVNCKKKHLGCDPARPCRRCVLSGKEATCVDVTHKKRGRPPLKAEEASLRTYAAQVDNAATSGGQHGSQSRRVMHRATSSRELRPMTDLQISCVPPPGTIGMRTSAMQPHRWPPASMYPQNLDPALTMQRNIGHRRFSSSGSAQSLSTASPPGFVPVPAGYNPALGASRMHMVMGRPISAYANPGLHPAASPPQYQQPFGVPIPPYTDGTRMANRLAMGEPPMSRDPREGYLDSPVRLPPIYPPTLASPSSGTHAHRLSDPYPGWSPRGREEGAEQRHQLPPHGYPEPLSPASQMRQGMSDMGYGETVPRRLSSGDPTAQQPSSRAPSTHCRDGESATEADTNQSRPAKRRKMALDDMVNG
ncbi:putative C6 transcription factor [Aspergillus tanneri]|uniref:Transcription activator of gluconeogenesis acuK n=1 Tax=Aspergillus tanneri TaxID=1220188 RepID=A0A5M9N147_9EURO|nr:uncharacterized protein ATNIH1004_000216 [Aspergillus tanneri]KAA8651334.1 hypothetical protein ATNIH1004_000216 [Aspergillus tanneri]